MPPGTMLNVPRQPKPNIKIEGLDESWRSSETGWRRSWVQSTRHGQPAAQRRTGPEPPPQMKWTKEFEIVDGVNPNGKNGITLLLARMWQVETPDMRRGTRNTLSSALPC